jgi:hypothetical protein
MYLLISAVIIIVTAIIHSVVGEKLIISPTLKLDLPQIFKSDFLTKRTLRFAWHITSIVWIALAGIILTIAQNPLDTTGIFIIKIISLTFLMSGLISLVGAHGKHFSWYVFLAVSVILWIGVMV